LYKTVHIICGTPGRVLDLAEKGCAKLKKCKMVVMDEADKLLSPDFVPIIEQILAYTHKDRQVLLYSATFPRAINVFAKKWLNNPVMVNLMDSLTLRGVTQFYCYLKENQKVHCLHTLFKKLSIKQCIIFCSSR